MVMNGLKTIVKVIDGNKCLLFNSMSNHRFLWLLVANLLMALLIVTVYHTYIGNDEMIMCWIASGQFMGEPNPHLVFSNVVFGQVVSFLYELFPSVEWYSLSLILIHAVSYAIIQDCIQRMPCQSLYKAIALVVVCVIEIKLLVHLTFTTTAGILATASLLLLWVREKQLAGMLLFVVASCVRFSSAMLVGAIFLSFYPLIIFKGKFIGKQFACLCLCVVLAFGFKAMDRLIYRMDDAWEYYYQTNKARSGICDHVDIWRVYSHLPDNIVEADVRLLYGGIRDACIFDNQMLIQLHKIMEGQTSYKSIPYVKKVKYIPYFLKDYLWYWLALSPLLLLIIIKIGGGINASTSRLLR